MKINGQASELNGRIRQSSKAAFEMLSEKGRAIYFPKAGILAQSAEAKGTKLNATIGIAVEDGGAPMRLNAIAENINLRPDDVFTYASSYGKQQLREKWKEMICRKNPSLKGKSISLPVVSLALTHGLSTAGYLFAGKGDRIIVPDLYWENYNLIFENTYGARLETFEFFRNGGFNIEGFRKKLAAKGKKKIVLLNFPNNPCGYTPTEHEIKSIISALAECARSSNVAAIIDDAYLGLVYKEGVFKESVFGCLAGLHERILAVKIDGISKEDYAWGLRVGFVTFGIKDGSQGLYSALEAKAAGAIRATISNAPHLSQSLALKAYCHPDYENQKREKYLILKSRFDEIVRALEKNPSYKKRFEALPFNSGYFMCIKLKNRNADAVRKRLIEKYSTGVIADKGIIRIAFSAVRKEAIPKLLENIYNACSEARSS